MSRMTVSAHRNWQQIRQLQQSSVLTEALRDGEGHYGAGMLEQVERDYREMVEAVRMLQSENEN